MAKEIIRINQKRTNAFTLSPMAFALAACGGGGSGHDVSTSSGPAFSWPYPTTLDDPSIASRAMKGLSLSNSNTEGESVVLMQSYIEDMIPDGGSVAITWFRDSLALNISDPYSYLLTSADIGKNISVEVLIYDSDGKLHTLGADQTTEIANLNNEPNGQVVVYGKMQTGEQLTAISDITDADGMGVLSFQWLRDDIHIQQANSPTFTLSDVDVGKTISVEVSYIDGFGKTEKVTYVSDAVVTDASLFREIVPVVSTVVGETQWADTWYTGDAELAVDGNRITSWTYEGLGQITFDLGKDYNIDSVFITFDGSVSNGNSINLYVDDVLVASGVQPAHAKTWDIEDTIGRYITYETVAEPHNEYLQVATWSEISEFSVMAQEIIA